MDNNHKVFFECEVGLCLCQRPKTLTHTTKYDDGRPDKVVVYGEKGEFCKYCGKKWDNH